MGWFGWEAKFRKTPKGWQDETPQPLHFFRVDLHRALSESRDLMDLWSASQQHPTAPAFSGGVLDAWPAYASEALAIARSECGRIRAFMDQESRNEVPS